MKCVIKIFPQKSVIFGEEGIKTRNMLSQECLMGVVVQVAHGPPISSIGQSPQEDYISHDAPWCSPMLRRKSFSQPRF